MTKKKTELALTRVLKKPIDPTRYDSLSPTRKLILEYIVKGYSLRDAHRASGIKLNTLSKNKDDLFYLTGCSSSLELILTYYRDRNPGMRFEPAEGKSPLEMSKDDQDLMIALTRGETMASVAQELGVPVTTVGSRVLRMRLRYADGKWLNYLIVLWLKAINNW
ncbi:MAG: hypothetical protein OQK82_02775 [Candidatus Pacearchaeota archaeon]|nr:hypothetical protein [Candidatus Pacearchaeota archaeon]